MKVSAAIAIVKRALADPLDLWPGYSPRDTPPILFDEEDFACLNHPAPPAQRPAEPALSSLGLDEKTGQGVTGRSRGAVET